MRKTALVSASLPAVIDAELESSHLLCLIAFPKSPSKNYAAAVALAKRASRYTEATVEDAPVNLVGFEKTPKDAALASSLLRIIGEWNNVMIWSGGYRITSRMRLNETLSCYVKASKCRDPRAHCIQIIDDPEMPPSMRHTISIVENAGPIATKKVGIGRFAFPCSLLMGEMKIQRNHPATIPDQIQAASMVKERFMCPRLDPESYQKVAVEFRLTDDI